MRKGLFVVFLIIIIAFFMIGYQTEQHQESGHDELITEETTSHVDIDNL